MRVIETRLQGPILIEPDVHGDARGFYLESYRANVWAEHGVGDMFVQDNHSRSGQGVLRGMHFSVGAGQAKLVRCARGAILDVVVDLRRESPTYGEWEGHELSDDNARQLYVPIGFAPGFCVLSEVADVTTSAPPTTTPPSSTAFATTIPTSRSSGWPGSS
jgi:dTDP-4-dehydrorhamnose 3,5-epimerase